MLEGCTMKTTMVIGIGSLAASASAFAQPYDMMGSGYGMMSGGFIWMGFIGLLYFTLAAFLFSLIFWLVHGWMAKGTQEKRK